MGWPYPWQSVKDPLVIPPGALRSEIVIQSQALTPDTTTGEPAQGWSNVLVALALIEKLSTREQFQSAQFAAQVTHVITIPYPGGPALAGGMRVVFGSRTFNVQTVENVLERDRVMRLMCLEVDGVSG